MALTSEQLLAGGAVTHEVTVPPDLLGTGGLEGAKVVLRPLTVRDLQRITTASRDDESLSAGLMIQQALVDPPLKVDQVSQLSAGLASFLVERINSLSGISTPRNALQEVVQTPLAKACFVLAKEFGWTPEQVSAMSIGQILLYLEMTRGNGNAK